MWAGSWQFMHTPNIRGNWDMSRDCIVNIFSPHCYLILPNVINRPNLYKTNQL